VVADREVIPRSVWRWLQWPAAAALVGLVTLFTWLVGGSISASAGDWIAGMHPTGTMPHAVVGRILRALGTRAGVEGPMQLMTAVQLVNAALQAALILAVGRLCRLGRAAWIAPVLVLGWAGGRAAIGWFAVESIYATASLALCVAALALQQAPRAMAAMAAMALFVVAIGHPMGMPATAVLVVVLAVWPRPGVDHDGAQVVPIRPIWLAWGGAVLLFGALVLIAFPGDRIKVLWDSGIHALRRPAATPIRGGLADLPLFGAAIAVLARVPLPVLLLAVAAGGRALMRERAAPLAVPAAHAGAWLVVAMVAGGPTGRPFDVLLPCAPLLTVLAVAEGRRWLNTVWGPGRGRPAGALALLLAIILASAADDLAGGSADPRSTVARYARVLDDPTADLPAALSTADLSLISAHPVRTAVLPAHRDGNDLARRLHAVGLIAKPASFHLPFGAEQLLLHLPARDPLQRAWLRGRQPIRCAADGRRCLYAME